MIDPNTVITQHAVRAGRALGAIFFSIFGGAWLALWIHRAYADRLEILGPVMAIALCMLALAYYRFHQHRHGLSVIASSPQRQRSNRLFHRINAGQWVVIVVGGNVLVNIGLSDWVIPLAIFVIGMHFLPLAHIFSNRPHYATGAALISLAVVYPQLAIGGPADPIGCLGAGVILLVSALWAVTANSTLHADATRQ